MFAFQIGLYISNFGEKLKLDHRIVCYWLECHCRMMPSWCLHIYIGCNFWVLEPWAWRERESYNYLSTTLGPTIEGFLGRRWPAMIVTTGNPSDAIFLRCPRGEEGSNENLLSHQRSRSFAVAAEVIRYTVVQTGGRKQRHNLRNDRLHRHGNEHECSPLFRAIKKWPVDTCHDHYPSCRSASQRDMSAVQNLSVRITVKSLFSPPTVFVFIPKRRRRP